MSPVITAFLVFCAAVFSTLAAALIWEVVRDALKRREVAKRLKPVLMELGAEEKARSDSIVRQFEGEAGLFSELFSSLPGLARAESLIRDARVDLRPESFFVITFGLAFGLGVAAFLLSGFALLALLFAVFGAATPYLYLRRKAKVRLQTFEEDFPEAIELLTRAIRAGHPLASGMQMVGDEGPRVVAEEFRQTFEEQRFGLPFNDALLGMVDRVDLVDVRIFTIAVLIQREVGGNLAEILDNLAETIRGRFYIRRQLRVYTAQGRMSGYALAALPIVVGLAAFLIDPEYFSLLYTTQAGRLAIFIAIMLQIMGVFWIRKIIDIEI